MSTNQQCCWCDEAIKDLGYRHEVGGHIIRFCSSEHRNRYVRARQHLTEGVSLKETADAG